MTLMNSNIEHLDKFLRPIEVGNVICHGGEAGPSIGVVTRLTPQKVEVKRLCAAEQHENGKPWGRENYLVTGYYWQKTLINAPERCIVLPLTERDILVDFLLSHRIGETLSPAEMYKITSEIPESVEAI